MEITELYEIYFDLANKINKLSAEHGLLQIKLYISAIAISIYCFVILWNQRKIKKMLRQIQEQKQDKPQE